MKNLLIYDLKRGMYSGIGLFYALSLTLILIANEIFANSDGTAVKGIIVLCFLGLSFLLYFSKISHITQDFVTNTTHMSLVPKSPKQIIVSHSLIIFLYSVILGLIFGVIAIRDNYNSLYEAVRHLSALKIIMLILFVNVFVLTVSLSHMVIRKLISNVFLSLTGFFLFFVVLIGLTVEVLQTHMELVMINAHWILLSFLILPVLLVTLTSAAVGLKASSNKN